MAIQPHAIPYQGSKRALAPLIAVHVPRNVSTFFEPFAGSAAMSIYAARHEMARRFIIADSLEAMVELIRAIIEAPQTTASRYGEIWHGQTASDTDYFNKVRDRFNSGRDPVDLLYVICRCVKNAVRFNSKGNFTQSVDRRRLGMRPERMSRAIEGISTLLKDRTEFRIGDWRQTTADARSSDFVYLDPPYLGTSIGRDKRYHQQLSAEDLVSGLQALLSESIRFALSYDGRTGDKTYGPPLPRELGLTHLQLHAGTSSQATLSGRPAQTVESLYLSPGLANPCQRDTPSTTGTAVLSLQ